MKDKILYKGDTYEALWSTLGYMGPFFLVTMNINRKSPFMYINGIRSGIMFVLFLISNVPVILMRYGLISLPSPLGGIINICGFIVSILLFIDYCYATYQTVNGYYKKTFFVDKIFNKLINEYMYKNFF